MSANDVDFLEQVDAWIAPDMERIYAIMNNLSPHRSTDVLLFSLTHLRWEFVFQPKYAPYLNLIEPWWKVVRSLALKGRRFTRWAEVCQAVQEATAYCTPIVIFASGAGAAAITRVDAPALADYRKWHKLGGCTTKQDEICRGGYERLEPWSLLIPPKTRAMPV